jgi:hypothetical protein
LKRPPYSAEDADVSVRELKPLTRREISNNILPEQASSPLPPVTGFDERFPGINAARELLTDSGFGFQGDLSSVRVSTVTFLNQEPMAVSLNSPNQRRRLSILWRASAYITRTPDKKVART